MIPKSMPSGHDPTGGCRFPLVTNAKRLPGDHAQTRNQSGMTIRRKVITLQDGFDMTNASSPKNDSVDQDQFLTILSREQAMVRFEAALFPRATPIEERALSDALGCALVLDIVAPIDVPPFDRSNVDGFAVHSADLASAGEAT